MEQKRTLWITAAVGVFLLVVLGAAIVLYSPAARATQTIANSDKKSTSSNGWISLAPSHTPIMSKEAEEAKNENLNEIPQTQFNQASENITDALSSGGELKVEELSVYAKNAKIYTNNEEDSQTPSAVANTTTINLTPIAETKKEIETPIEKLAKTEKEAQLEKSTRSNENKITKVEKNTKLVANANVKAKNTNTVKKTQPKSTATKTEKTQYWIQVTSLTSRKSADSAREVLGENKITADVFTYEDAKGQLFYRVRVGPYTTKTEAQYWQNQIAKIENFKSTSSYVAATKVEL